MKSLGLSKRNLARIALGIVWLFALQAMTTAGARLARISSPADGERVSGRIRVQAETDVSDAAYLIFRVDGQRPHSTNVRPYHYWMDTSALPDGPHTLAVELYGRLGLVGESAPVTINVHNRLRPAAAEAMAKQPEPNDAASERGAAPPAPASQAEPAVSTAPLLLLAPGGSAVDAHTIIATQSPVRAPKSATASPPPQLTVLMDGKQIDFDVAPDLGAGRAYGALRAVIEESGGVVHWLTAAKQAIARRAGMELRVHVGSSQATFDEREIDLGAPVVLRDGRTLVPLRAVCEPLGFTVEWSAESRTVQLCSTHRPVQMATAR